MNANQARKCRTIIHAHAAAVAAGNAVPVPGLGVAADMATMVSMTMSLCGVFGGNITKEAAKALSIVTVKNTMLKQPVKVISKELAKFVPLLGMLVAPAISVIMIEAAGWAIAKELEQRFPVHGGTST